MAAIDWTTIEQKWQAEWEKAKLGAAKIVKNKPKFFCIFAYPGVSGYLHVGHMRGYTYTDIVARYKRAKGFSVLFPVGIHASGNIALAFALKVQRGDKNWIDYLKRNGATDEDIKHMIEPKEVISYFTKVYIDYWKKFGFICDWDRVICTIWPDYKKFIAWQFKKLKDVGLLVQGPYYATFCPIHGPVAVDPSETDISKGGNAEKLEYTLIKFKFGDYYLVAATLRPETIFGLTNIWINPEINYEKIKVGREIWIVSHECGEKLAQQKEDVGFVGKVKISELLGKNVYAPTINKEVPILPSKFVKADVGTGIVMSVPSDAPYDWIALKEFLESDEAKKYKVGKISPIPIITTPGYSDFPAKDVCEKLKITSSEDPALEDATKEVYSIGFHKGVMKPIAGEYANMPVALAKEKIKSDLVSKRLGELFYDLSEEVLCRCGAKVFVKKITDQWFIKYSDKKLKDTAKEHIKSMHILPKEYQNNLPKIIDWYQDRPCARIGNWIGSELVFDPHWIIEPISDSTLYPAMYVIAKWTNSGKLKPEELTEEFFDYVFLGKGEAKKEVWRKVKEEFDYWYPLDMNFGGKEHQTVHFPVFIFNHIAILRQQHWPKGIFSYWWITGKGGKISKSKGGAQPVPHLIERHGADSIRLYYSHSASAFEDTEWDENKVISYSRHLKELFGLVESLQKLKSKKTSLDKWLLSRWNATLKKASEKLESYDFREAANALLFEFVKDLRWYVKRGGDNKLTVNKILADWTITISPFVPHIAEEIWHEIGKKSLVSAQPWPKVNERAISSEIEEQETAIEKLLADIAQIIKLVEKPVKKIYLYVIPKELNEYSESTPFLAKEFNAEVFVFANNDPKRYDPQSKASKAKPGKPGIYVE